MKTRDIKQLQTKSEAELKAQLAELKASLAAAELEHSQRKLANTTSLRSFRGDIARVKTVMHHKALTNTEEKGGKEEK